MKHANIAFFIPHVGCPNKCSFCNQNTISGHNDIPRYEDITNTLDSVIETMPDENKSKSEIAFFGGSFTAINRDYMIELLSAASKYVGENLFSGIRVSTRPDAIDDEIISILKKYKVTSVELGAQSLDEEVLKANLRGHTAKQVVSASNLIKESGISLGLQMMTGLYKDTKEKAIDTAKKIIELNPDTVRIYPTVILKDTYLAELYKSGTFKADSLDESVSLCAELLELFEANDINVIRVGLHDQESLKENYIAGAYHPAFHELVMNKVFLNKFIENKNKFSLEMENTIFVNPANLSQAIGQKKSNLLYLENLGLKVKFSPDKTIKKNEFKII